MSAELLAHRGQELVGIVGLATRREPGVQRRAEHVGGHALVDRGLQRLLAVAPTASGKTAAAIRLCHLVGGEVVSADSMQIYRGMDIGTAKPTLLERSEVRHHMIDVVAPSESFSTGQFIERITGIIAGLHENGKVPVIVGGTGLYIKAITRGIFSGPSADWALREGLIETERGEKGALYSCLSEIDPEAAERIEPNDTRRVIRAIEVCLKSGDKMSLLQEKRTNPLPYDFTKIGLTRERKELYGMIDRRVDQMIGEGLVAEVKRLLGESPDRTPQRTLTNFFAGFLYLHRLGCWIHLAIALSSLWSSASRYRA